MKDKINQARPLPMDSEIFHHLVDANWIAQEKINGERLVVIVEEVNSYGYSKTGKVYKVPEHLQDELNRFPVGTRLDGELKGKHYHVFDMMYLGRRDVMRWALWERLETLGSMISGPWLVEVGSAYGKGVEEYYDSVIAEGGEGVVMKDPMGRYSDGWYKVKPEYDRRKP